MKTALVIDWGIGGFSLVRQLKKDKAALQIIYVSDSGFTPYGKLKPSQVRHRINALVKAATLRHKIDFVVIACNAASTAFLGKTEIQKLPLINMIEPTAAAIAKMPGTSLTVVGGNLTVQSHSYLKLLKPSSHRIEEVSLQPLSALIEAGQALGRSAQRVLVSRLGKKAKAKTDIIVLACTHYPASTALFKKLYGCRVYDPAGPVSAAVQSAARLSSGQLSLLQVYTTGSVSEMPNTLQKAFGMRLRSILFKKFAV